MRGSGPGRWSWASRRCRVAHPLVAGPRRTRIPTWAGSSPRQWFRALVGIKSRSTRTAKFVVEQAIAVTGGAAFANSSELGRLYRDVLAGGFHPSNEDSAHSTVATALLGPE